MGQTKRFYELIETTFDVTDFDYDYEQWLEEQRIVKMQREAELAAYEEMLSDGI